MSEPMDIGEEEDEVEDLSRKSRARVATATRNAFRKVHIAFGRGCGGRLITGWVARRGY